jgi:hypothetical protein
MRGPHLSLVLGAAALAACAPDDVSSPSNNSPALGPVQESGLPILASARVGTDGFPGLPEAARNFQITLRFINTPTAAQQTAFQTAASRWEGIIHGDEEETVGTIPANGCGPNFPLPAFTGTIDDIMINVLLQPIDGPGAVLGAAGACFVRDNDGLPVYGLMFFDVDDLAFLEQNNLLDEVIVHEMGHVLGFSGGIFNLSFPGFSRTLLADPNTPTPDFLGKVARAMYVTLGGRGKTVPIEGTPCGAGTRNSHWDEATFFNELMTGFINGASADFYNPLSEMTAGAMHDLGYKTVQWGQDYEIRPALVDPCPQPAPATAANAAENGIDIASREIILEPVGLVR